MGEINHFFLTLVRHGETDANRNMTYIGHRDVQLNDMGLKQAEQLSQHLDCNQFNQIFSSELSRALETAKIVVKSHQRIQTDIRLKERNVGPLEGLPVNEVKVIANANSPSIPWYAYTPEGAESFQDVHNRVVDFFNNYLFRLLSHNDRVLMVSHGGVIAVIIKYLRDGLKSTSDFDTKVFPHNASVSEFKVFYDNNGFISADCLKLYDIQHLSEECKPHEPTIDLGE